MPPTNDNIANAQTISGASGSTTGDNTGATLESGEATALCYTTVTRFYRDFSPYTNPAFGYGGGRTVWFKWTCPVDGWYKFETSSSGGSPIVDSILAIIDRVDFANARLGGPDDDSGVGTYSALTIYAILGLTYYIAVDGYNGSATDDPGYNINNTAVGTFALTWGSGVATDAFYTMVRAKDDYNSSSSTVSQVTNTRNEIRDVQNFTSISGKQFGVTEDATDTLYIRNNRLPLPGYYKVEIARSEVVGSGSIDYYLGMVLDGMTVQPTTIRSLSSTANDLNFELTNVNDTTTYGAWVLPVSTGSELALRILRNGISSFGLKLDVYALKFTPVEKIANMATPNKFWTINNLMLGATSVPIDQDNDGNADIRDVCVVGGDVYLVFFRNDTNRMYLNKFSGNSWSTISSDVGSMSTAVFDTDITSDPAIAIDTDGVDVYIAYGKPDGTQTTVLDSSGKLHRNWKWYCTKYVVSSGIFTDLGTGQRHYSPATNSAAYAGYWNRGIELKISPTGDVWVAWSETDPSKGTWSIPTSSRGFLSYWNGSTWIETQPPDPPNMHGVTDFRIDTIHVDDQRQIELCFTHHDGGSNWPSAIYCALYPSGTSDGVRQDFVYSEYSGATWSNTVQFKAETVWPGLGSSVAGSWQQGMELLDGTVPTFVAALGGGTVDKVAVAKLKADGTTFEGYLGHEFPSSVIGLWTDPTSCQALYIGTTLMVIIASATLGGAWILVDEEFGTGQGWHVAAKTNANIVTSEQSVGYGRIYVAGRNVYFAGASRGFTADTLSTYLGVWSAVSGGAISSYSMIPIR